MPVSLRPIQPSTPTLPTANVYRSAPSLQFIRDQPALSQDDLFEQIGAYRPNTITRGLSFESELRAAARPIIAPPPPLTVSPSLLTNLTGRTTGPRIGTFNINLVDLPRTLTDLTGSGLGLDRAIVGTGGSAGDPFAWFGEREISMVNAPSRLLDYGLSVPVGLAFTALGKAGEFGNPPGERSPVDRYGFQNDPRYWSLLGTMDDAQMEELAGVVASQTVSGPFVDMLARDLVRQFKTDRDVTLAGLSSGNERIDYLAKKNLEWMIAFGREQQAGRGDWFGPEKLALAGIGGAVGSLSRNILSMAPVIGTPVTSWLDPISPEVEQAWLAIGDAGRREIINNTVTTSMLSDLVTALPVLSGVGSFLSVLKAGAAGEAYVASYSASSLVRSAQMTWNTLLRHGPAIYAGYSRALNVTNGLMAYGMAATAAHWALGSFVEGYDEAIGRRIDASRPFSSSALGGLIDLVGLWSSGTYGAWTTVKATGRVARLGTRYVTGGADFIPYLYTHGGSVVDRAIRAGGTLLD
ncbi:MAG TPA: hypothetical protein VIV06_03230, partial [Candidatus Limnocylindrales bacterium]